VLRKTLLLLGVLMAPTIASAQDIILTGTIKNNSQAPIASAFVAIPQLSLTQVANASGEYRFVIPAARAGQQVTLEARSIGHQNTSVPVTLRAGTITQNLVLAVRAVQLDEIVVSGTAGRQERRAQAAAVAKIDAADIVETAPITSVSGLLQARTPGLVVRNSSGTTGTSSDIRIRGISSISLSNSPLVFVDGIRVSGGESQIFGVGNQQGSRLNDIKLEDIESVDVVKGPAAATLYGSDAVAGVINIITKRGRVGSGFVQTVNGEYGVTQPNFTAPDNFGRCSASNIANASGTTPNCVGHQVGDILRDNPLLRDNSFNDAHFQNLNYSLQGGGDKYGTFVSVGSNGDHGLVPNNFYGQKSGRASFNYAIRDNLHMDVGFGMLKIRTQLPRNDNDIYGYMGGGLLGDPRTIGARKDGWYSIRQTNAIASYENVDNTTRFQPRAELRYSPLSWFNNRLTVGGDMIRTEAYSFWAKNDSSWWQTPAQNTGQIGEGRRLEDRFTFDYLGTVNRNLSPDVRVDWSFGGQAITRRTDLTDVTGRGLVNNDVRSVNSASELLNGGQESSENRQIGALTQAELSFRERLYLKAGVRADQASSFGANSKTFYSPNVGVSYVISDEDYFRRATSFLPEFAVTQLRLRAAYGISGRQPTSGARSTYDPATNLLPNGSLVIGVRPNDTGNPDLRAEKGQELEMGADIGFLRDRLSLEATYFHKKGIDQILEQPVPASLGADGPLVNIGSLLNTGWELASEARLLTRENIAFSLRGSLATLKNKLLDLGGLPEVTSDNPGDVLRIGYPLFSVWDYHIDSINVSDANPANWRSFVSDSLQFVGNGANYPGWDASLAGTLTLFKDLSFYAQVDGRGDRYVFDGTNEFRDRQFGQGEAAIRGAAAFGENADGTPTQSAKEEYVRRFGPFQDTSGTIINRGNVSGAYLQNGKFWRLREAAVNYSLPRQFVQRYTRARSATLGLTARNVATWTAFTGLDPETDQFLTVPPDKRYTMRFSITF
jgi:TonB-dependent starch-binding outer membrane protein SusC